MPVKGLTQAEIDAATAEVIASGGKSTDRANRLPGETGTEANARITAAYKSQPKPELTQEGAAAGAQIKFVRSEAGGVGNFREIFPIGTPIPTERTTAYGNTYDAQGNLISGTGLKPGVSGTATTVTRTPDQQTAYDNAKALAQSFVDAYGGQLSDYFNVTTGIVTRPSDAVINKKFSTPTAKTETSRVDNGDGTFTVTYSDNTTAIIGTKNTSGDYKTIDGILNFNGKPFSGTYNGKVYENGIVKTASTTESPTKTLIETRVDAATGNTIGYFSDGTQLVLNKGTGPVRSQEFKDAYALLEATFRDYGLESLVPTIKSYMERDLGPEQATLELRTSLEYIARFKGNDLRRAAGKNALREDVYLATERAYDETLTAYGQANYFGIDRQAKQLKMAQIIGNDISADEFKSRVDLAVARVTNADPTIKKLLKDFYPNINDADLVGYFLNPAEGLPKLTEKVTSAEIGSAFLGQGLAYTQQRSAELAQYGIDRAGALKGAKEVKEVLPESEKFTNIYGESGIKYTQQTAEEEFLKDSQDAATKRKRLASMERGSFGGSAGNAPGAYSTGYLKKSSTAGLI